MADIIGMGFDEYVQKQVLKRQEKLRYGQTDLDVIRWNNTNNAFLRLTSGVNVSENFVKNNLSLNGDTYSSNNLAKYFKLFAAQAYDGKSYSFTKGVGYNFQSSYGFASPEYTSYGLVPPPGLISANIKALNRGSLREATIQIQCNNLQQFQIIEALYLRLKYSILLEWGHNLYFNNKGELINSTHDLSDEFLEGVSQTDILKKIQSEREASNGNYDAFFGLVTNFEWTVRPDGGYDVTLIARATGDVIESLKLNTNTKIKETFTPPGEATNLLDRDRFKTTLNRILYAIAVNVVPNYPGLQDYAHGIYDKDLSFALNNDKLAGVAKLTPSKHQTFDNYKLSDFLTGYETKTWEFSELSKGRETKRQHYIKLGALLRIIDSFLTIYDDEHNDDPLFNIDYNFNNNFCFTIPDHISLDPKVCLIPYPTKNTAESLSSSPTKYKQKIYEISVIQFDDNDDNTEKKLDDLLKTRKVNGKITKLNNGSYAIVNIAKSEGGITPYTDGLIQPSAKILPITDNNNYINELSSNENEPKEEVSTAEKINKEYSSKATFSNIENYNQPHITGVTSKTENTGKVLVIKRQGNNQESIAFKQEMVPDSNQIYTETIEGFMEEEKVPGNNSTNIYFKTSPVSIKTYKIVIETFYNSNFTGISTSNSRKGVYISLEKMNNGMSLAFKDLNDNANYIARTMHMLVNMEYICEVLADNYNVKTGELNLYKFLEKLMNGIQNALGNINSFEIIYKEDTNTFKIIDNTFIPGLFEKGDDNQKSIVEFLISTNDKQGIKGGSFVKDINFKTKLSNAFATMTTIGAQKNGAVVGSDATALSKWNDGLEDRIIKTRTNPNGKIDKSTDIDNEFTENRIALQELVRLTNDQTISDNHISQYKNSINDYFKARISSSSLNNDIPGIGFIPFDLEINMMGLSGPRIYESYTIDTKLLPKSYQDTIQFICSGVSHNISNGEWTTTLNSICGPKQKGIAVKGMKKLNLLQITSTGTSDVPSKTKLAPDQLDNLKILNKTLKDKGFNTIARMAIAAVCGKESQLRPQSENSYARNTDDYIRDKFDGKIKPNGPNDTYLPYNVTLSELKKTPRNFFNYVYKKEPGNIEGSDDGYNFRGRGLNQITSRANYTGITNFSKKDYINYPDLLNEINGASDAAAWYFGHDSAIRFLDKKYKSFAGSGDFKSATDLEAAIKAAAWLNAGSGKPFDNSAVQGSIRNALAWKNLLETVYQNDSSLN